MTETELRDRCRRLRVISKANAACRRARRTSDPKLHADADWLSSRLAGCLKGRVNAAVVREDAWQLHRQASQHFARVVDHAHTRYATPPPVDNRTLGKPPDEKLNGRPGQAVERNAPNARPPVTRKRRRPDHE